MIGEVRRTMICQGFFNLFTHGFEINLPKPTMVSNP